MTAIEIANFNDIESDDDASAWLSAYGTDYNVDDKNTEVSEALLYPYIAEALNELLKKEQTTTVLLETMAGKGSEIGGRFEELRAIINKVELSEKMGVCLDTCHIYDGGYDIVEHLDEMLDEFDRVIGLKRLKAVHLNDSMNPMGSHKDRHQKLGEGTLGLEAISRIINNERLRDLPFLLETPNELDGYAREISMLKELRK